MGPNGSGKTTLGKIIMGMYPPTEGRVLLEGRDIGKCSLPQIGARIGYLFQNPDKQIFNPTVYEELSFGLHYRGYNREESHLKVEKALDRFELRDLADAFPLNLSRGEKQRLAIASIMVLEPDFLIFDEPTTGLDHRRKTNFADMLTEISSKGTGFILISHDLEFCRSNTDRFLILKRGVLNEDDSYD